MTEENIEEELQEEADELFERLTIVVDKGQEPYRIDKFLMHRIEGATRNKIQQAIEAERVLINDRAVKSNYKVKANDKIVVYQSHVPESAEIVPENVPLIIVFADEDLLLLSKP